MNREIKFRAYQPEAKGDLKWWSWQELRESDLNTIFRHPEKYHLMQYTGLKDKNGVEIYEGDILACGDGRVPTLVFWDTENNCWSARNLPRQEEHKLNKHFKRFIGEVIGNKWDDSSLLLGGKQDDS